MENYTYIETYGCSANQNNSEIIAGLLKQSGTEITNNQDIADIIIINSCAVKSKTENKIKRRIQDLEKTNKLLIITGCMSDTDAKYIKKLNKNSIFLGSHHIKGILNLIRDYKESKLDDKKQLEYVSFNKEEKILLPKIPQNKLISITQILEGCLMNCTYCKTKLAKGDLFSYPEEDIVKSIESDLKNGAKEVWLTSQDNSVYGLDRNTNLPNLLKKILNLNYNFKLRLGMANPGHFYYILDEMIEVYRHPKMYKFLHIPIQSGSDKILKEMKRLYKKETVEKIISRFREKFPDITIATDIIIGYPTETDYDFKESMNFVKEFRPDVLNLSKFSKHKGTAAENLEYLDIKIVNKRNLDIMREHRRTALENKQKFLNKELLKIWKSQKQK